MIKACIFDLDGTLTDTLESLVYSVGKTLEEVGLPAITREQCQSFVGNGARKLVEDSIRAAGDTDLSKIDQAMDAYRRIFDMHCTYHVTPYEGIVDLLKELKVRGIKTAVLSNKPHMQTVKVVEEILGNELIDLACGQKDSIARKPAPDGMFAIMDSFGVKLQECLYIGDSEVDAVTGANAGVQTVCVTWGFRSEEELRNAGAENLINKAEELLKYLIQ